MVVRKDETGIKGIQDLEGKKIAVQIGTTGAERAGKVPGAQVTSFDTNSQVFLELNNKGVDAVIIDKPVAAYYLTQEGKDKAMRGGRDSGSGRLRDGFQEGQQAGC